MMGVDFLDKTKRSFEKKWDRSRVKLATADLFTRQPTDTGRTAAFEISGRAQIKKGDTVIVEHNNGPLIARSGFSEVARIDQPSNDLVRAVQDSCNIAKGTVQVVHKLSGIVEISLC